VCECIDGISGFYFCVIYFILYINHLESNGNTVTYPCVCVLLSSVYLVPSHVMKI
jgi:hypothetical protein